MCRIFHVSMLALFIFLFVFDCSFADEHDPRWAKPLFAPGVPNFFQVAPNFYRSAQPTGEGMRSLEKLGIKTVITLRYFHSDKDELEGTGLSGIKVPMHTWNAEIEDVVRVLAVLSDPSGAPYLLHCQHGADRTGMMTAMYRIVLQGWEREEAIREMKEGEYGFHAIWDNLIRFIETADTENIKRRLLQKEATGALLPVPK